jgi:hypothetical protein
MRVEHGVQGCAVCRLEARPFAPRGHTPLVEESVKVGQQVGAQWPVTLKELEPVEEVD